MWHQNFQVRQVEGIPATSASFCARSPTDVAASWTLPNYMVCMLYVPCDHRDKKRVNNSKLRATEHKNSKRKQKEKNTQKLRSEEENQTFSYFLFTKHFVAAQPDTLRIARSQDLRFFYCSSLLTLKKCCYDLTKVCKIETFAGEISAFFACSFWKQRSWEARWLTLWDF